MQFILELPNFIFFIYGLPAKIGLTFDRKKNLNERGVRPEISQNLLSSWAVGGAGCSRSITPLSKKIFNLNKRNIKVKRMSSGFIYRQVRAKINYFYVQGIDWILREFVTKELDKNQLFSCEKVQTSIDA